MAEWKVGDVVQIKSGSPPMTVHTLTPEGDCNCVWFVNGEPKYGTFASETLRKVPSHLND